MAADADRIDPLIFRLSSLQLHLGNVNHIAICLEREIRLLGTTGINVPITVTVLHDVLGSVKERMTMMEEDIVREEAVLELFPTRSERTEAEGEKGGGGGTGGGVGESPGKTDEERRKWTKDMRLLCGGPDAAEFPGQKAGKEKVIETSTLSDESEVKIEGGGLLPLNLHDGDIVKRLPQVSMPMPMPLQLPYTLPHITSIAPMIGTSQRVQDHVGDRFFAMHPSSSVRLNRPLAFPMRVYEPQHHQQAGRKSRRCWSEELHRRFKSALEQLGGPETATPKQIRELMKIEGLTNDEVKSHLQKYRINTKKPSSSPSLHLSLRMKHFSDRSPDSPLEMPCFSPWNEQIPDSCGYDSDTERGDLQEDSS